MTTVACNLCGSHNHRWILSKGQGDTVPCRDLVRCLGCGLVFVHPCLAPDEILRQYTDERLQREYLEQRYLPREESMRRFAEMLLSEAPAGTRLLDVGAGPGLLVSAARKRGWDAVGLDPSGPSVRFARERLKAPMVESTVESADFDPARFDGISMVEVLEHLTDPRGAVSKAHRWLSPSGFLLVTTPNWDNPVRWVQGSDWEAIIPSGHLYYFTRRTLGRLLKLCGFSVERIRTHGLTWVNNRPRLRRLAECFGLGETLIVWARPAGGRVG